MSQNCFSRLKSTFRTTNLVLSYVPLRSAAPELQVTSHFSPHYTCTLNTAEITKTQTFHKKPAHVTSCHHLHDQICHVYIAVQSIKTVWHPVKCLNIKNLS